MWIRMTSFAAQAGRADEMRKTFNEDIQPVIKSQPGLVDALLLEPADGGEFISMTMWRDRESAERYDSGGTYSQLVGRVGGLMDGQPTLRSYEVKR